MSEDKKIQYGTVELGPEHFDEKNMMIPLLSHKRILAKRDAEQAALRAQVQELSADVERLEKLLEETSAAGLGIEDEEN